MNENIRKIFDILGIETNQEFKVMLKDNSKFSYKFKFDVDLQGYIFSDKWRFEEDLLKLLLNGAYKIIKFSKKKKLRDLTEDEFLNWKRSNCGNCKNCIFKNVICTCAGKYESLWVECKELYSDSFLNQEIEVKE